MSSAIVDFLTGAGTDSAGRDIFQVLAMKDDALEETQDYIQWLFPLRERSGAPSGSPTLTEEDVTLIQRSSLAASALAAGSDRMAIFYFRNGHWLTTSDHNHLRITRIIKSLRLLRGDASADAFRSLILARVVEAGSPVGAPTLGFWQRA